jgi:hypothetical protein
MWRHKLTIWNILLFGGTCLLLFGIYSTWWGVEQATHSRAHKGPKVPAAPILRDQQPLSAFEVIVQKDLFSLDRQGPTNTPVKTNDALEGRQLLGIIIIGDTRAAIIAAKPAPGAKKEGSVEVVYLGEQWNDFKIEAITKESVVFQSKDGRKTLTFPE